MRRVTLPLILSAALLAPAPAALAEHTAPKRAAVEPAAATGGHVRLRTWDTDEHWRQGTPAGVRVEGGRLVFDRATSTIRFGGGSYDRATWKSPWAASAFSYDELIASWSAFTRKGSWIDVSVRGRTADGDTTTWDTIARWQSGQRGLKRHSGGEQSDDGTRVNVDTWVTPGLAQYQLRVGLHRRVGTHALPVVDTLDAMTSNLPEKAGPTSRTGPANGTVLPVPRYSQMVHSGHYPEWGGGGEAWCSPTSTSMVLAYYDALPAAWRYGWVGQNHPAPWVDHAARSVYDHAYDGAGNWPFNTAYAAPLAGRAFVTRLRSLREAERFIAAGIPVVASIAFGSGELDGTPIGSSNGHLLVIVGFRENGNVVVNDPAAAAKRGVRRTYDRAQFEKVWLEASGGLSYVIRDETHPLPAFDRHSNW
jgi:hypothetical protein